ncbi:hypothetical protein CBL_07525 [Carabus blaptoides fortunei]
MNSPFRRGATVVRNRVFLIAVGRGIHESNLQQNKWDHLIACRLSQPTVIAFTFYLLIVMNLEQASGNKSLQSLFSRNSRGYITMYNNGAVDANTSEEGYSNQCLEFDVFNNITCPISPMPSGFFITLYNPAVKRYLCLTKKGKPVGRKKCTSQCVFSELPSPSTNGYLLYKLFNMNYRLAFTKNGRPTHSKNETLSTLILKKSGNKCQTSQTMMTKHHKTVCSGRKKIRRESYKIRLGFMFHDVPTSAEAPPST